MTQHSSENPKPAIWINSEDKEPFDAFKSDYEIDYNEIVDIINVLVKEGCVPNDVESIIDMEHRIEAYGRKIKHYMSDGPGTAGTLYFIPLGEPTIIAYLVKGNQKMHIIKFDEI